MAQKGDWSVGFGYCRVLPWFQYNDDIRFPPYCCDLVLNEAATCEFGDQDSLNHFLIFINTFYPLFQGLALADTNSTPQTIRFFSNLELTGNVAKRSVFFTLLIFNIFSCWPKCWKL